MNKNQIVILIDKEIKKLQEAAEEIPLQIKSLEMTKKYFSTISGDNHQKLKKVEPNEKSLQGLETPPMMGARINWEVLVKSAPTDKREFRAFVRKNYPQIKEKTLFSATIRLASKGLLK